MISAVVSREEIRHVGRLRYAAAQLALFLVACAVIVGVRWGARVWLTPTAASNLGWALALGLAGVVAYRERAKRSAWGLAARALVALLVFAALEALLGRV